MHDPGGTAVVTVPPGCCGTCWPPEMGTPDADAVAEFGAFLHELHERGKAAIVADPRWTAYLAGTGPAPAADQ